MKRLTLEQIKEYINKVKPTYTLLSDKYINSKSKLLFECNNNHKFAISWTSFQQGRRCKYCSDTFKKSINYIKKYLKINKLNFKLLSKKYINSHNKLLWKCKKNHIFSSKWNDIQQGYGCPDCFKEKIGNIKRTSINEVKQYIESQGYKFIKGIYKNTDSKLLIECSKNHQYYISFHQFKSAKSNCPICAKKQSKGEREIINFLKQINIKIEERIRGLIGNKEIDIYLPDYKIGIEYNGLGWHSTRFQKNINYHYNKYKLCKEKGIILLQIFQDEWKNKQNIIKEIILYFLNPIGKLSNEANNLIYKEENNIIKINNRFPIHLLNKDINEYKEELPAIYCNYQGYNVYDAGKSKIEVYNGNNI